MLMREGRPVKVPPYNIYYLFYAICQVFRDAASSIDIRL